MAQQREKGLAGVDSLVSMGIVGTASHFELTRCVGRALRGEFRKIAVFPIDYVKLCFFVRMTIL